MDEHAGRARLEVDLQELKKLDAIRSRAQVLRADGVSALADRINDLIKSASFGNEGFIHRTIACRVAIDNGRQDVVQTLVELIEATTVDALDTDKYGVLTVSQFVRAATALPAKALSSQALASWYLIFREFYRTPRTDPSVGAARAGELSNRTAYVTTECLVALLDLERVLVNTASYFQVVAEFFDKLRELSGADIAAAWQKVEIGRLSQSTQVSLVLLESKIAIVVPQFPGVELDTFSDRLSKSTTQQLTDLIARFDLVLADIRARRASQFPNGLHRRRTGDASIADPVEDASAKEKIRRESETSLGHSVGIDILERAKDFAVEAVDSSSQSRWWDLARQFRKVAAALHDRLRPTQAFLSTVVDRQIAAKLTEQQNVWDPSELAFAAFGYCKFEPPREHDRVRLQLAARYVAESIGADGHTHPRRPFYRTGFTTMQASSAFCLSAWAKLTHLSAAPLGPTDAKKLLPFFEDRRKEEVGTRRTLGWMSEVGDLDGSVSLWSTALAVDTLKGIEAILGGVINNKIFPHFTVREPLVPPLDDLFYPDFGLSAMDWREEAATLPRDSVGVELQRMRAHVMGAERIEHISSLVLHGPAGTGKTTLAESLAVTCNVPLVEVTPSDISQAGADGVESRARAVFEALGLLSNVVILFDEFDPLLQRRNDDGRGERNIFMFLTPGMLPKLKLLHDQASSRRVAYILNTNLIGSLDEAAVRQGRFDRKVGLYPPDVLSRLGRIQLLKNRALIELGAQGKPEIEGVNERLGEFVALTGGVGMTALAKNGWYSLNLRKISGIAATPFGYILGHVEAMPVAIPEPEDKISKVRGAGQAAEREFAQWKFVDDWDRSIRALQQNVIHDFYKNLESNVNKRLTQSGSKSQRPK
jgi:ATPase family associated with various cellular activities (AAA)